MPTVLSQVQMPALATSMMAAMHGAVRAWDESVTLTDLFGYSGHAFILNIERTLCPSGPTAWDWGAILFPLRQMYALRRVCATCDMRGAEEARELIWQRTVESIDAGHPAILWDAVYPEFYLAIGYDADRTEYIVQGPGAERLGGSVPYAGLGVNTGQVWALYPGPRPAPDRAAARELALRGAVTWHRWVNDPSSQWTFGGDAWQVWIDAMREEEMAHDSRHLSFNHQVYAECRRHAAAFLQAQGLDYAGAAAAYGRVAAELDALCAAWPCPGPVPSLTERRAMADHLAAARDAETDAVAALETVMTAVKALSA